jgi:diketogulonate reductase-like aldo/keto reductase
MDIDIQGEKIPALGYGTFQIKHAGLVDLVANALDLGYRHIDTAQIYENEHFVGQGIEKSNVDRDDFFLTTKIWIDEFRHDDLLRSFEESLEKLKVEQTDLILLHWPNDDVPLEETIGALNEAKNRGMTRHIGVSNFTIDHLEQAVELSDAPIFMNQIEIHPFLDQSKLIEKCRELGVGITAYCPLARAEVIGNETIKKIGDKYDKTEAQVAIRWLLDQDLVAIPKTEKEQRQEENLDVFDFELTSDEVKAIASLAHEDGRLIEPSFAPDWD